MAIGFGLEADIRDAYVFLTGAVKDEIVRCPSRLMLHVHGFDYRFREALIRSATFKEHLRQGEHGAPTTLVLFSWPSLGSLSTAAYRQDVVAAKQTGPAFVLLLSRLVPLLKTFRAAKPKGATVGISSAVGTGIGQFDPTGKPPLVDVAQLFAANTDADALSNPAKLGRLGDVSARVRPSKRYASRISSSISARSKAAMLRC